jgi:succinate dehydrogenase / fumarate reductase, membrane anchor subunit
MSNAVKHWKLQRYSALINLVLAVWLAVSLLCIKDYSFDETTNWIKSPVNFIFMSLFFVTSFLHMRLGLQVVIEDYISNIALRKRLIITINSLSWLLTILSILLVLKIVIFN